MAQFPEAFGAEYNSVLFAVVSLVDELLKVSAMRVSWWNSKPNAYLTVRSKKASTGAVESFGHGVILVQ